MDYVIICFTALFGAGLTLFSGFGLGTILLPVFGLFFPIEIAVVLTALVHFFNNIFKLFLFGKNADKKTILQFGIPAILFAFVGAFALEKIANHNVLFQYEIIDKIFEVTYIKVLIGLLLIFFSLFEIIPKLKNLEIDKKYLPIGGILSGFFGGLSGHQGALRSAFLIRVGLSKEVFIATGVVIACLIDVSRLSIYIPRILQESKELNFNLVFAATLSAFVGVYFGNKILKKTTYSLLQNIVAMFLLLYGFLLIFGVI